MITRRGSMPGESQGGCGRSVCCPPAYRRTIGLLAIIALSPSLMADPARTGNGKLLDESEYRTDIEEIVVTGQQPEWRKPPQGEWRPERFELQQLESPSRMEWFPKYAKDERDNYDGPRDPLKEKPEIQIFKWKF